MLPTEGKRPRIGYLGGGDRLTGFVADDVPVDNEGSTDLYNVRDRRLDQWRRLLIPRNYLRMEPKYNFANFNILVNLITDPDRNPTTLKLLEKVLRGYKGRLLNPPWAIARTTRDQVARTLADLDGLTVPKVARFAGKKSAASAAIERAGCIFPAILRSTGTHSGRIIGLVDSAETLLSLIEPNETYFLTEFLDARSPDGLFRKLRVFFIGQQQVIRHLLISDHWNVHASVRGAFMANRPALVAEERKIVEGGIDALPARTQCILREIKARMRLDFFGADLALREDGSMILFEANPTMNFFPFSTDPQFAPLEIARERAAVAYGRMLHPQGMPEEVAD